MTADELVNAFTMLLHDLDVDFLGRDRQWRKDHVIARVEKTKYDLLKRAKTRPDAAKELAVRSKAPELVEGSYQSQDPYERWRVRREAEKAAQRGSWKAGQ